MTRKFLSAMLMSCFVCLSISAQSSSKVLTLIKAGRLIDVRSGHVLTDQAILIEGDRIKEVGPAGKLISKASGARVIDLSSATLLPGLIDCHTHILLQGDVTAEDYDQQL